tara:strand:+ start:11122 stop:11526 length:405 start_codon:yes stop_codon:yes gene_type:complete
MSSQLNAIRSYSHDPPNVGNTSNAAEVERLLTADSNRPQGRNWPRLDNTEKVQHLRDFANRLGKKEELSAEGTEKLKRFFEDYIRRKKLTRVKEVSYDKDNNCIISIPGLVIEKETCIFRIERPVSSRSKKSKD